LKKVNFSNEIMRVSGLKNLIFLNKNVFPSGLPGTRNQRFGDKNEGARRLMTATMVESFKVSEVRS
jgi:hypothetical protein